MDRAFSEQLLRVQYDHEFEKLAALEIVRGLMVAWQQWVTEVPIVDSRIACALASRLSCVEPYS